MARSPRKPNSPPKPGRTHGAKRRRSAPDAPAGSGAEEPLVVGIGASAGGLEAVQRLLGALPPDTGMAFVLVQHLSPAHPSALPEILQRATSMPVVQVQDEPPVVPDRFYVIPPDRDMVITDGHLRLIPRETRRPSHAIDHFFHALAADRRHLAIGVILSGTASDGTFGVEEIKAAGGITFAQDASAQQRSMPDSAVASGCIDYVLPPERIAEELVRIARHPLARLPGAGTPPELASEGADLAQILQLLRDATGVEFSHYKSTTLYRRITRRVLLRGLKRLGDYARLLREQPDELEALYQDVLINVTGFFRNPETFEVVQERIVPELLKGRPPQEPIRLWVIGCSTGEEAYSYAMILAEGIAETKVHTSVQIFATDLNAAGIDRARLGIYPKSIEEQIPRERLRRFFVPFDGSYRVIKSIREMCVFARHNVFANPPFSHVDLVSCRNLLIYLSPAMQQKILPLLHYALRGNGYLVLGNSETVGQARDLFEPFDAEHRVYRRLPGRPRLIVDVAGGPLPTGPREFSARAGSLGTERPSGDLQRQTDRFLLARYAPPAIVVGPDWEILEFRGDTAKFLALSPGRASLNLLKMAREGLLIALRAAIEQAKRQHSPVRTEGVRVRSNGGQVTIDLEVVPVDRGSPKDTCFLVLFVEAGREERLPQSKGRQRKAPGSTPDANEREVTRLSQELAATREYLQSVIEQQESAYEELQSANEEAQSTNEELQSMNEELETSKEEIQSSNEELATLNDELSNRNAELARANNDLVNLVNSLQTAMIMVGVDLCVRRYSPMADRLLDLRPRDIGRPLAELDLGIKGADLDRLVSEVIDLVQARSDEVSDRRGRRYLLRTSPYRTLENKIDGAVLMFVDVDALVREREFAETIVATVREPVLVLDPELRVQLASRAFCEQFGLGADAVLGQPFYRIDLGRWDVSELRRRLDDVLRSGHPLERFEMEFAGDGQRPRSLLLNARRIVQEGSVTPLVVLAIEDITQHKLDDSARRAERDSLVEADLHKNQFLAMLAHELRNPLAPIRSAVSFLKRETQPGPRTAEAYSILERQLGNLSRLIEDLLDIARITQGKIRLVPERVELQALLRQAVGHLRDQLEQRSQTIALDLPEQPVVIVGDRVRLEQVFVNLLSNAVKYGRRGGHVWVALAGADGGGQDSVTVSVRDDGEGISAADLPRVFDMFVQSERAAGHSEGGLGVGLTLVRRIVELHGGQVTAASPGPGGGSTFTVGLPITPPIPPALAPAVETAAARPERRAAVRRRILVVDDNADAAAALELALQQAGHEVATARDAVEALAKAARAEPEVFLLDIGLPGIDGCELARRLRAQPASAAAQMIAISGYGRLEDQKRAREAGFDEYLIKPIEFGVLQSLLDRGRSAPSERS